MNTHFVRLEYSAYMLSIALSFTGCTSLIDPTPKISAQCDQTSRNEVTKVFSQLYLKGQYMQANTLMCHPDDENILFIEARDFYKLTIGTIASMDIRIKVADLKEFEYFDDTRQDIEQQTIKIRQHYFYRYYEFGYRHENVEVQTILGKQNGRYCVDQFHVFHLSN